MCELSSVITRWCDQQELLIDSEKNASELKGARSHAIRGHIEQVIAVLDEAYHFHIQLAKKQEKNPYRPRESVRLQRHDPTDKKPISSTSCTRQDKRKLNGVVIQVGAGNIVLAVQDFDFTSEWGMDVEVTLTSCPDELTFRRLRRVLGSEEPSIRVLQPMFPTHADIVFGKSDKIPEPDADKQNSIELFNSSLNEAQQRAVLGALHSPNIHIIHGPPGTGKTTTICEIVRQMTIRQNFRILVCAPSNVAVDNILLSLSNTRLSSKGIRPIRLGHVGRVHPNMAQYTLNELLRSHEQNEVLCDIQQDINKLLKERCTGRSKYSEIKKLRNELRMRERKATEQLIMSANMITCTCSSAAHYLVQQDCFDAVLIDEASQSLFVESFIPLLRATRWILVGDPCQLPPTVLSGSKELEKTLMGHLLSKEKETPNILSLLDTQYRMHEEICGWSNQEFYEEKLKTDVSSASALLCDLPNVESTYETCSAIMFADTREMGLGESSSSSGSKESFGESMLVEQHVRSLKSAGIALSSIGVITPYSAQAKLISESLRAEIDPDSNVEVSTVDAFQGREKLAVILSLVRSNVEGEVGFLSDSRRMNVALTRAQRHLLIIGDSDTMNRDSGLRKLCSYLEEIASYVQI